MTPNFIKFIDYLLERVDPNNVSIEIATNGTITPSAEIIEKLNEFKMLYINVSLDSMDASNDYQRMGGSYVTTFDNTQLYGHIFKNVHVSIHSVVSILNANSLANTLNILIGQHNYHVSVDFVTDPEHLSLLHAPKTYIDWVLEKNKNNPTALTLINTFINSRTYNETYWKQFIETTKSLDVFYNKNIKDYNPELVEYLKENNYGF